MRYEIVLAPQAVRDFRTLRARLRAEVRDGLDRYLRFEPTKTSRARIKRLRGMRRPRYRLRIGEMRVYYDVEAGEVRVVAIVAKAQAADWLRKVGERE